MALSKTIIRMAGRNFGEELTKKFDSAREKGSLLFTPSEQVPETVDGIQYLYTVAPALQKKPTAKKDDDGQTTKPKLRPSPWSTAEKDLLIEEDFEDDYMVVLNKFAVVPRHFLLITKKFESQSGPLNPDDLAASFKLIKRADKDIGKRHVGFYNAGIHSGASIAHRHIQFLELPAKDKFSPFVDELVSLNRDYQETQRPLSDPRASFAHFVVPVHGTSADELGFRYSTLMSRVLTVLRQNEIPPDQISYNFVFTQDWMMAVPRRVESVEGRGINALGTIGLLLAQSQQDLDFFKSKGPDAILHETGFPPVDVKAKEDEYDY